LASCLDTPSCEQAARRRKSQCRAIALILLMWAFVVFLPAGCAAPASPNETTSEMPRPAPSSADSTPTIHTIRPAAAQEKSREPINIDDLVRQLGDPRFAHREIAQERLSALGESALDSLLAHLDDPDPEIARRVLAILPAPATPEGRAEVAVRLLAIGSRDHLRRAVVILFADPSAEMVDAFEQAAVRAGGAAAAVAEPILEQLQNWRVQDDRIQRLVRDRGEEGGPGLERLLRSHAETPAYLAEAAYWSALEARDAYFADVQTTRPAGP
jgi:hypothetical protein